MKYFIIPALIAFSTSAAAIDFETQATSGRRWAETKVGDEVTGTQITEYNLGGYGMFHPNIGAGPVFTYQQVRDVDLPENTETSFFKVGVEAYGRYDLNESLTPYAKLRYNLYSKGQQEYSADGNSTDIDLETDGFNVTAGMKYNVTDKFHILGETGMGVEMIRTTGVKAKTADGTFESDEESGAEDFNSRFVLVGLGMQF